jgi:TonB family protein
LQLQAKQFAMEEIEPTSWNDGAALEEPPRAEMDANESLALAAAQYRALPVNRSQPRLRVLGIPLPIAGVSWTGSILIHAALIIIAAAVYQHLRPPPTLRLALGDGGVHSVGMMWRESTPGGAGLPQLSETDPAHTTPADSMAAVMNQMENQQSPQSPVNSMASTYAAPELIWGAPPPLGAGHSGPSLWGNPATHHGTSPAQPAKPPPAQRGEGTGRGKSVGAGRGDVNGGQAGVPAGTPDPTLPAPVYPEESRRRGEEGLVKLSVKIASDGSVGSIDVVSEPPYPRLTRSAIEAVRGAHFDRAYGGVTLVVPYNFVLH